MKITLSYIIIFFCFFSTFAQKSIILNGKIVNNKTASPTESVTVYLIHPKDSSVVAYTISDKNGLFKLETKASIENLIFKISAEGYQEFSKNIEKLTKNIDLGIFKLLEYENKLNEVVIKSTAPPIRIKKDTLEFNASSFKLRPDANVEALLRQLPGVTIDADKKITVNGKEVSQILVNGKPFFGEDGKIALQNLPSEIIKKVQVSDTKTKEQEFTKQASTTNTSSINLTIEKDKNKGFFGKVMGGYGSSDRYESSALLSYFKDKRRISFLASSNNINATGFSMDEVFDNMGGGRNTGTRVSTVGRGPGIIKSNMIGVNYTDEWFKGAKSNGNYYFTNSDAENKNKTTELTLLPTGSLFSESHSNTNRGFNKHNADFNLEYEISPSTKIIIAPKLEKGNTTSTTDYYKETRDNNNHTVNVTNSLNTNDTDNTNFQNNINLFVKSKKKGRYFTANIQNENSKNDSNSIINSSTVFNQANNPDDIRNQNVQTVNKKDKYSNTIRYTEPVNDSLSLNFTVITDWEKNIDDKKTFDRNTSNSDLIDALSNYSFSKRLQISPKAGFSINKKKFNLNVSTGTYFVTTENYALYKNAATVLNKNYVIPEGTIQGSYRFTKSKGLFMFYDRRFSIPKDYQVLAVDNLDNPLATRTGNPDLKVSTSHVTNLAFSDYDYQSRSGYYIYANATYFDNQIVTRSDYNTVGKQITTYDNVYGTYNSTLGTEWNKTIKKNTHTFGLNFGFNTNYNLDKGFTNGQLYTAKTLRISPNIRLSYDYGKLLSIKPSYNFAYNDTKYTNSSISSRLNTTHNFNIEMTNFWPKNWVFGNDFGYSYNSNISGGYKKYFYLWNTSLSYKFAEDKMTFKVKVYDLLNQNQSTSRTITPTAVVDAENTVLKRYVMFSLLYKFQNFAVKKKN
ncbi:TonB-dependent receptor [Flavobacterium undicola]|uniref:TonB-dependent receptor n=1 Tax=Flavobacterium undicola TaxID=1932779 RepID=UPI0013785F50|nr:TonB-dependent receptor [Flavobacterium undicola]MBA0884782.1 outer membrane beta-barrel protein [Flavobacterium undicola]